MANKNLNLERVVNGLIKLLNLNYAIFTKEPLRYEKGIPIYSREMLGDLAQREFPTTIDKNGCWTNSPYSDSGLIKKIFSRLKPTHTIYFSLTDDGNYRFNVKPVSCGH